MKYSYSDPNVMFIILFSLLLIGLGISNFVDASKTGSLKTNMFALMYLLLGLFLGGYLYQS